MGILHQVRGGEEHKLPKGDFAIRLDYLMEAGSETGYSCTVKRSIGGKEERPVLYTCTRY